MRALFFGLIVLGALFLGGCRILALFNQAVPQEEYLRQMLEVRSQNPHAQFLSAKRNISKGKGLQAERSLKKALHSEPNRPEFYVALGIAYEEQAKWRAAKRAYLRALELNPQSAQTEIRLGRLAWRRGHLREAQEWATKAGARDDSADLWRLRGEIAYLNLNYPEALHSWQESLKRQSDQVILQELVNDLQGYLGGGAFGEEKPVEPAPAAK